MNATVYETLSKVDMSGHVDKKKTGKNDLSYLSWPVAWAAVAERFPDANYDVELFGESRLPYTYDPLTGYMVHTSVTIGGETRRMWLPVMDSHNAAMKSEPYKVKTYSGEYTVPAATMSDVNKAIMRCFVKNIAMFGLGLNVYAGEEKVLSNVGEKVVEPQYVTPENVAEIERIMGAMGWKDKNTIAKYFKVASIEKMTAENFEAFKAMAEAQSKAKTNTVQDIDDTDPTPDKK